jgi:hypothetical protein
LYWQKSGKKLRNPVISSIKKCAPDDIRTFAGGTMKKFSFVVQMPHEPGALHRAAAPCHRYAANINRLQYNRRIDPATVFFEVTADKKNPHILSSMYPPESGISGYR